MSTYCDTEAARLTKAFNYSFGRPVTAYLTDALIVACSGFGVMHRHVKAEPSGRFQDGHRLRTSDIVKVEQYGAYWALSTLSGSFYVIVSLNEQHGWQTLQTFLKLSEQGVHLTPRRLQ